MLPSGDAEAASGVTIDGVARRITRKVPSIGDASSAGALEGAFIIPEEFDGEAVKEGVSSDATGRSVATAIGDEKDWFIAEKRLAGAEKTLACASAGCRAISNALPASFASSTP